ncbi:MAG: hypothetical protein CSYNP_04485 [Syntrophus sp. SKADARSKE-3]|nr:hypothetical protein [Syntrophus sp. SKADARSKE-3]
MGMFPASSPSALYGKLERTERRSYHADAILDHLIHNAHKINLNMKKSISIAPANSSIKAAEKKCSRWITTAKARISIHLRMFKENESRVADVLKLLKMNKGNNSGVGIGCVSWDGDVHPNQF